MLENVSILGITESRHVAAEDQERRLAGNSELCAVVTENNEKGLPANSIFASCGSTTTFKKF
jgi:hypothetical protein